VRVVTDVVDDLDERKQRVLRTIVAEYVTSGEPVGSSRVVAAAGLECSAATVRNEMAVLEERGLIMAPHTSAGRVPTDLGYRAFVEMLRDSADPTDLQGRQRELIDQLLSGASDVDDLLARTTNVLSQLTRLVSLVIAPAIDQARLKLVELVSLGPQSVMLLLVADTGSVTKRVLDLPEPVTESDVDRVRLALQDHLQGRRMGELGSGINGLVAAAPAELRSLVAAVAGVASATVADEAVHQMYVSGRASLATNAFKRDDLSRVLALLEEEATLARVLGDSTGDATDLPVVRIGTEHDVDDLASTSLVAQRYQLVQAGALGVLGPTRMDYAAVLASVRAVADHLESTLADLAD
jgi:heat-inducible transcriptional repressor